jgi:hypothetical protein
MQPAACTTCVGCEIGEIGLVGRAIRMTSIANNVTTYLFSQQVRQIRVAAPREAILQAASNVEVCDEAFASAFSMAFPVVPDRAVQMETCSWVDCFTLYNAICDVGVHLSNNLKGMMK